MCSLIEIMMPNVFLICSRTNVIIKGYSFAIITNHRYTFELERIIDIS